MFKNLLIPIIVVSGIFLSFSISANVFASSTGAENLPDFKVKTTQLAKVPNNTKIIPDSIRFSYDMRHVSFISYQTNTEQTVMLDNIASNRYYAVSGGYPLFSEAKDRHAFIAYKGAKGKEAVVVIDGKEGPVFDNVDNLIFSADNSQFAYRALKNQKQCIVLNGIAGPFYDGIPIKNNMVFSPDSKQFAYVGMTGKACFLVLNGVPSDQKFNFIDDITFSYDSKHVAYKARIEKKNYDEKWCLVRDGNREERVYDKIFDLVFSLDSKHLAYAAIIGKEMVVIADGKELVRADVCGIPQYSIDSKILSYGYQKQKSWYLVHDNQTGPKFDVLFKYYSTLDSKSYAYIGKKGDKVYCMLNGEQSPGYDKGITGFKFSLDSKRHAYSAASGEESMVVIDGKPGKTYRSVGEPYFSPDSRHCVHKAINKEDDMWVGVLNRKEFPARYAAIQEFFFSPNSKHVAYQGLVSLDKVVMVVDGVEQCADKTYKILGDPYFSPDDDHIAFVARAAEEKWNIIINGYTLPQSYGGFLKGTPLIFDSPNHLHTVGLNAGGTGFVLIDIDIPESVKLKSEI